MSAFYYMYLLPQSCMFNNCILRRQLEACSVTRPLLSTKGVAFETNMTQFLTVDEEAWLEVISPIFLYSRISVFENKPTPICVSVSGPQLTSFCTILIYEPWLALICRTEIVSRTMMTFCHFLMQCVCTSKDLCFDCYVCCWCTACTRSSREIVEPETEVQLKMV